MTKNWYPVIDYTLCVECGNCTDKCKRGVYDEEKVPTPIVKNPDNCKDSCHGCANLCPNGAISYVGDDGTRANIDCGCGSIQMV